MKMTTWNEMKIACVYIKECEDENKVIIAMWLQ